MPLSVKPLKMYAFVPNVTTRLLSAAGFDAEKTSFGSLVCAVKPGDGSAREQAASSQKMLLAGCLMNAYRGEK